MLTIGISEFRANMNQIIQKVNRGAIVCLTIRGTEVARLVPPDFAQLVARAELEKWRATASVGDVLSPVVDEEQGEVAR